MAIGISEHADLEDWARQYGGTAILGFISTLLLTGKVLHYILQKRGLIFGSLIIPPAMLSGLVGLIWFTGMEYLDPIMTSDLRGGLEALKANVIIFVFAAYILGITCGRANSQHNTSLRGIIYSLVHEGMPMVIYSQILNWGQTTCCLLLLCLANTFFGAQIPNIFAAMVPLGLEAGSDVVLSSRHKTDWTQTVVEEAESLGMMVVCVLAVVMFTLKPYFIAQGWLGPAYVRDQEAGPTFNSATGVAEAFQRSTKRQSKTVQSSTQSTSDEGEKQRPSSFDDDLEIVLRDGKHTHTTHASLGAHLALIALTAFMSFGLALSLHLLEMELGWSLHWISGVRMFKLAMCCALLSMIAITQLTRIKFSREWFMLLCGLMLDLLLIAALSKAYPKPKALEQTHYLLCSMFVLICTLWNIFCFVFVARSLFPNYWFERALTLAGDTMGHSYTGLLFARTLDPSMESPVPAAYAYKLILFFIPSSGAKQTIVITTLAKHGPWAAFLICLCVVATWLLIFDAYFRKRFIGKSNSQSALDLALGMGGMGGMGIGGIGGMGGGQEKEKEKEDVESSAPSSKFTQRRSVGGGGSQRSLDLLLEDSMHGLDEEVDSLITDDRTDRLIRQPNVQCSERSSILSQEQMNTISSFMPYAKSDLSWQLSYSLRRHGANLSTLLSLSMKKGRSGGALRVPCIVVIEDSWGYIFGGFVGPNMLDRSTYYGNGESFVFSVVPEPQMYKWTGKNELFVLSHANCFAMGGGGEGFAFQLDDELDTGVSNRSDTFDNPVLSSSEFFKCLNVEVWTLDISGFSI